MNTDRSNSTKPPTYLQRLLDSVKFDTRQWNYGKPGHH